jgi:phosphomannomutase
VNHDALSARVRAFLADDPDPTCRAELATLLEQGAWEELADRFRGPLEFGTAGLRGTLGAGEHRMNRAVVIKTTAGLAAYLTAAVPDAAARGVVLGRDARRGSQEFVEDAAAVLAGAGIPAYVFELDGESTLCPTPFVAHAVRKLGAAAGVMVTASHNPPEYNGYKVYAQNGAQIIPPIDSAIAAAIAAVPSVASVPRLPRDEARARGLRRAIPAAVVDDYYADVVGRARHRTGNAELRVVYTPMHGVGDAFAHALFAKLGFTQVVSVPEQAKPDGAFPTVRFPNPEEKGALDLAFALARKERADLVIANDPDADRLAIAVPDGKGDYVQLDGNQVGVLLGHYLLAEDPAPAKDRLAIATIVSSPLLGMICRALGVRYASTLTGFKWIANRAMELEEETGTSFVFGYEEALGYAVDALVRDKDGLSAAARFAELAALLRSRGGSVLGRLEAIYREFGLVVSKQHNVTRPGGEGAAAIRREMAAMRSAAPSNIGEERVVAVCDYLRQTRTPRDGGAPERLALPPSDVLTFELEGGSRVTMRPSGTEPKIKYYLDVVEPLAAEEPFDAGRARALARLARLEAAFVALAAAAS